MKILLVYPQYPDTFWSFKHALKFIMKKAAFPPLGLITVASMLPSDWSVKLIDTNVQRLSDKDILWADFVFVSAMNIQQKSVREILSRCYKLGIKTIGGGPLFTTNYENFSEFDHLILDEAEVTLPMFLEDLRNNNLRRIYTSKERPDVCLTPVPRWELVKMKQYSSMNIQYSRGCPFDCEFCDIVVLNGRRPRTKSVKQLVGELEALYEGKWRGSLFIVDDNFIGNKKKLKIEILPAIIEWQKKRKFPFQLYTESSIGLAKDDKLIELMVEAGFTSVFIGIETPNEKSLAECNKSQNKRLDLVAAVKKIQNWGLEVQGGFIVGFDNDPPSIFGRQIEFIQKSGITTAMVGLLNALPGTKLFERLHKENRIVKGVTGDNTDCSINFEPKMNRTRLLEGYKQILKTIYGPREYYERVTTFLKEYKPRVKRRARLRMHHMIALAKSFWLLGVKDRGRWYYWRLLTTTLLKRPKSLPLSVTLSIYGYHFREVVKNYLKPSLDGEHQTNYQDSSP